jgi:hypothetical protein
MHWHDDSFGLPSCSCLVQSTPKYSNTRSKSFMFFTLLEKVHLPQLRVALKIDSWIALRLVVS